jgi:peptidylprolyl isomerase
MKMLIAAIGISFALLAFGCGEGETTTVSAGPKKHATPQGPREYKADGPYATVSIGAGGARPKVDPPDRRPPGKTLVRDLEVGTGRVARRGDLVTVHYVGINYKTGKEQYGHWPPDEPTEIELNFNTESKAWEEEIEGMRVGGLREMIIPSRLLFGTGTIDYALELMRVEEGL